MPDVKVGKSVHCPEHRLLAWVDAQLDGGVLDD
jgi:hypothetical protein